MVQKKQTRKRPQSRAAISTRTAKEKIFETDGTYFFKLVLFVILGTLWLKFQQPVTWLGLPVSGIPAGLLIGLVLATKFEKYQADRKIWYAILVVVAIISYFVPAGIVI
jgi:hypothetical protein